MTEFCFRKVHGTGNDFVFLDLREVPGKILEVSQVQRLCHRHFGVGADGVLALVGTQDGMPVMRIYNADGSVAEMCGNGLRCFVKIMHENYGFSGNPLAVLTDDGVKSCRISSTEHETIVSVSMGGVYVPGAKKLLTRHPVVESLMIGAREVSFVRVATGNPHAVMIGTFTRSFMEEIGPPLSTHPHFPQGTNVEFLELMTAGSARLTVCERGVGFTLACGTGTVAAIAVAVALERSKSDTPVEVELPGGNLTVSVSSDFSNALLEGPAVEVFHGSISVPGLS
jgi:diaminopimelate epimerase